MTRTLVAITLTLGATAIGAWLGPTALDAAGVTVGPYDAALLTMAGLALGLLLSLTVARGLARTLDAAFLRLDRAPRGRTLVILAITSSVLLLTPLVDDLAASMVASPTLRTLATLTALAVIGGLLGMVLASRLPSSHDQRPTPTLEQTQGGYLLDTSAIIDGRFLEAMEANVSQGPLIVPSFVLRELQGIAGDRDTHRRRRGRRGLDNLERSKTTLSLTVLECDDTPGASVDDQLLHLAHALGASLVTTDYNLDQVAEVRGISVVNANRIAAAMRRVHHPGDRMDVHVQRKGKEPGQGVGFLDDGTMVVVEQGAPLLGSDVTIEITSSLQTNSGRMLFARPATLESSTDTPASTPA